MNVVNDVENIFFFLSIISRCIIVCNMHVIQYTIPVVSSVKWLLKVNLYCFFFCILLLLFFCYDVSVDFVFFVHILFVDIFKELIKPDQRVSLSMGNAVSSCKYWFLLSFSELWNCYDSMLFQSSKTFHSIWHQSSYNGV